jgi:hypothetical protein
MTSDAAFQPVVELKCSPAPAPESPVLARVRLEGAPVPQMRGENYSYHHFNAFQQSASQTFRD